MGDRSWFIDLDFEWLWDSPQFADFVLEVYVTGGLLPVAEVDDEPVSPTAASPVRPACTPHLSTGGQPHRGTARDTSPGSSSDDGGDSSDGGHRRTVYRPSGADIAFGTAARGRSLAPGPGPGKPSAFERTRSSGFVPLPHVPSSSGTGATRAAASSAATSPNQQQQPGSPDVHSARDQRSGPSSEAAGRRPPAAPSTSGTDTSSVHADGEQSREAPPAPSCWSSLLASARTPLARSGSAAPALTPPQQGAAQASSPTASSSSSSSPSKGSLDNLAETHGNAADSSAPSGPGPSRGGSAHGRAASPTDRAASPPVPPARRALAPVCTYFVHAPVLAASSEYFRALLRDWCRPGRDAGSVGSAGGVSGSVAAVGGSPHRHQPPQQRSVLSLHVGPDDVDAAEVMLRFMYTGRLPSDLAPRQLLRLLVLADQYRVVRLMGAVNAAFAGLPLPGLSLVQLLALYELPEVVLEGGVLAGALSKLGEKLVSELGDLELVMDSAERRALLASLPHQAVRMLLQSSDVRAWNENTAVAALVEWVAGPVGAASTPEQRRALASCLRLQHCTHSYLAHIIPQVHWLVVALDVNALLLALAWSRADAATCDVYCSEHLLEAAADAAADAAARAAGAATAAAAGNAASAPGGMPLAAAAAGAGGTVPAAGAAVPGAGSTAGAGAGASGAAARGPAAAVPGASAAAPAAAALPAFVPRARPLSQRVTFDWSIDFTTLQQLYADSKATRSLQVVTSEPAFFGGFHWWLRYDLDASQPPEYREHLGIACHARLAGRKYALPCVKVRASVCARQDAGALGEGSYSLRKSFSYHVMHACPVGLWGFFGLTPDREEAAWRRYVFDGCVWLRCTIEECL